MEGTTAEQNGAKDQPNVGDPSQLKQRLKQLKVEKALVAREFKSAIPGSDQHAKLVVQMQAVSGQLKALESRLKDKKQVTIAAEANETASPPFFYIPKDSRYVGEFTIKELTSTDMARWGDFVESIYNAPLYVGTLWSSLVTRSFGHLTKVWVAVSSDGGIIGGVPLTFFNSRLFGRFGVSVPYVNYGGVLTEYWNVAQALLQRLQGLSTEESLSHIEVRTMQPDLWPYSSQKKVSMVLPLPTTLSALDSQLGAKVRAQSKKAEEHQPSVDFGGLELLDDFYRVFSRNMRDLGTPVYAKSWFSNVLSEPAITTRLVVVRVRGRPVSAAFLLGQGRMLEIPWASTIKAANALNTNMWMYRKVLDYAVSEGYAFFDFGRSTRGAGTYHFKKQWGAKPYEHHWYYITRDNAPPPQLNPDNPKYRLMIAAWKCLPVWLSRLIGPPIVKNLP